MGKERKQKKNKKQTKVLEGNTIRAKTDKKSVTFSHPDRENSNA